MRFSKIARIAAPLAFAAMLGLAACSKEQAPEEQTNFTEEGNLSETPSDNTPMAPPEVVNEPAPANVAEAAPIDTTTQDQQMQEDADASGMTSRVPPPDQTVATSDASGGASSDGEKSK